jgi:tetratricopeptide (TPR) repeat protein
VAAERLARKGLSQVLASAKKIAAVEMEKSAGNTAPESVQLELALAALSAKNFAFAEYYLQALTDSKNPKIKAAAYNAIGAVALKDDRVPEAVLYFKQSLKAIPNYKPALLNLGFAALKGGDLETARKALADMQGDWFVQYGLISVARMEGNESRAQDLCEKVISKEPQHKAALYNCALFELQNKKNFAKARDLSSKAASAKYGELGWDEKAMQLTNVIDFEEASVKRAQAQKKAAEKAAEKPANKADPKGPPKPGGEPPKTDKAESAPAKPATAPKK